MSRARHFCQVKALPTGRFNVRDYGNDIHRDVTERQAWDILIDSGCHPFEADELVGEARSWLEWSQIEHVWDHDGTRRGWTVKGFGSADAHKQTDRTMAGLLCEHFHFTQWESRTSVAIKKRLCAAQRWLADQRS
jgi:hypothetical protein